MACRWIGRPLHDELGVGPDNGQSAYGVDASGHEAWTAEDQRGAIIPADRPIAMARSVRPGPPDGGRAIRWPSVRWRKRDVDQSLPARPGALHPCCPGSRTSRESFLHAAAGLDVLEQEPAFDPRLAELDSVFLTPHINSATHEPPARPGICLPRGYRRGAGRPPAAAVGGRQIDHRSLRRRVGR